MRKPPRIIVTARRIASGSPTCQQASQVKVDTTTGLTALVVITATAHHESFAA
jgi:hypothetical protein